MSKVVNFNQKKEDSTVVARQPVVIGGVYKRFDSGDYIVQTVATNLAKKQIELYCKHEKAGLIGEWTLDEFFGIVEIEVHNAIPFRFLGMEQGNKVFIERRAR